MFKKLILLIVGGVAAAGGFIYYTQMPAEQADALVESLSRQKLNLENIARDIASSEAVKKAVDRSKAALAGSSQVQGWLREQIQGYAQQQQLELSQADTQSLVEAVTELGQFSGGALVGQTNQVSLGTEEQQRLENVLVHGDAVFEQHLGVSMRQFLTTLRQSAMLQSENP